MKVFKYAQCYNKKKKEINKYYIKMLKYKSRKINKKHLIKLIRRKNTQQHGGCSSIIIKNEKFCI